MLRPVLVAACVFIVNVDAARLQLHLTHATTMRGRGEDVDHSPTFLLFLALGTATTHFRDLLQLYRKMCAGRQLLQEDQPKNCSVTIISGDYAYALGQACGGDETLLAKLNPQIANISNIFAGDCICVPDTCTKLIGRRKCPLAVHTT